MRVDVVPRWVEVQPQQPVLLAVTIANPSTVIGGYALRILGADPNWVSVDTDQLTLFPDETRTVAVTLNLPSEMPAGPRRIGIQVRALAPPFETAVTEVDLSVPDAEAFQLRVDPLTVTGGRRATFGVVVTNTGNTTVRRVLAGDDAENKAAVSFAPAGVELAPGQHAVLDLRVSARRPWTGSPAVRVLSVYLDPADPGATQGSTRARDDRTALATATFIQRPLLSRGVLSLVGLLAAATVFAVVIGVALTQLVTVSAADRDLALQVAAAQNRPEGRGTAELGGTVKTLTGQNPVASLTVDIFTASSTARPIDSGITDKNGTFRFTGLGFGDYKLSFHGAGLTSLWYPAAATDADAKVVTLKPGATPEPLQVSVGGIPASVQGKVVGEDVSLATLYLEQAVDDAGGTEPVALSSSPASADDEQAAVLRTVPIGADGAFALSDVPTPATYTIVVRKPGYADARQVVSLQGGQDQRALQLRLIKGDGIISGRVGTLDGPLGQVALTASTGQTSVSTVSLTGAQAGRFDLRNLPTPGTYTVVASAEGYTPQTQTVTLTAGQKLADLQITLVSSVGQLGGAVKVAISGEGGRPPSPEPGSGVTVTVTDGRRTVQSVTASQTQKGNKIGRGQWQVSGLPVPGTYTVTFTRADLEPQTVGVQLGSSGTVTGGVIDVVVMRPATASLYGTVSQTTSDNLIGEATVTVRSATASFVTRTASVGAKGAYRIDRIPPGTYTVTAGSTAGVSPRSDVITLAAGDVHQKVFTLRAPAVLSVTVTGSNGVARKSWNVTLFRLATYPEDPLTARVTNDQGVAVFSGLDAGQYTVQVGPRGAAPVKTDNVTVRSSEYKSFTIVADGG